MRPRAEDAVIEGAAGNREKVADLGGFPPRNQTPLGGEVIGEHAVGVLQNATRSVLQASGEGQSEHRGSVGRVRGSSVMTTE